MEIAKMADVLTNEAVRLAIKDLENSLIDLGRTYEDAERSNDPETMAYALQGFNSKQAELDRLTGSGQQGQQQGGQLSNAQANFLSRRQALGDELSAPGRMDDYARAHVRAVSAGLTPDSPQYFKAIEMAVDTQGDGRQPVLNEAEAAKLCGLTPEEYAQGAAIVAQRRRQGFYQD
jgi:hypothetical protein